MRRKLALSADRVWSWFLLPATIALILGVSIALAVAAVRG